MTIDDVCRDPRLRGYIFSLSHQEGDKELFEEEKTYLLERGFDIYYAVDGRTLKGCASLPKKNVPGDFFVKLNPAGSTAEGKSEIEVHAKGTRYCPAPGYRLGTSPTEELVKQIELGILRATFNVEDKTGPIPIVVCDSAWKDVIKAMKEEYNVTEYKVPVATQGRFRTREIKYVASDGFGGVAPTKRD